MSAKIQYLAIGAIAGVLAALLLFDKTGEKQRLIAERDLMRRQLDELVASRPRASSFVQQTNEEKHKRETMPKPLAPRATGSIPSEITDEEKNLSETLKARQSRGEYVNFFEDPSRKKMLKESIAKGVQMLASANQADLAPLFGQFGLSSNTNELLLQHVSKINEAAMEVQSMMVQLEIARADYDKKIQALLSPTDLEVYKQHEASGAARREYEKIKGFAEQVGQNATFGERENLISIIQEARAYPNDSYLGPYDGLPSVAVGKENVLRNAEQRLAEVIDGANRAVQLAAERGLPDTTIKLLYDYYNKDVQSRTEEIANIRDPSVQERINNEVERRILEGRGNSPARN